MKRFLILIFLFLLALPVFSKKPVKAAKETKNDTTIVDTTKNEVDSLSFYRQEIRNYADSLVLCGQKTNAAYTLIAKNDSALNAKKEEIVRLEKEVDAIKQQLNDTAKLLSELRKTFESADFYELILYFPIDLTYDSTDIAHRLAFVDTLHLNMKYPEITRKYYDMVTNYHIYRMEVANCVQSIIDEFIISGRVKPDSEFTKGRFIMKLEHTQYWSKRHKVHKDAEIPYIERRLQKLEQLFQGGPDYNQKSFQQVYDELVERYDK